MQGKNPSAGLLVAAVVLISVFWTLVYTGSLSQPNKTETNSAEQHTQPKAAKASDADDRLADYTFWLTGFTGLLAFVSGIQGWLLIRADRAATKAADANSATTKRSMDLREKQFSLAADQHGLAGRQHGLQRLQYFAEYRPKVEIRSIAITPPNPGGPLFVEGAPISGSLVIRNTGGSDAKILETEYRFFHTNRGLPILPPLAGHSKPLIETELPHTIVGFGSYLVPIEGAALGPVVRHILLGVPDQLYIMGAIRYADGLGNERWMHFCRRFVPPDRISGEGSFEPIPNQDYEYQD